MLESDLVTKVRVNKLYLLPSQTLVRVHRIDQVHGKVFIYRYDTSMNDSLDIEMAPRLLTPAFKIGEVAKMLQKSPDTLRKYERDGLISSPKRWKVGDRDIRIYTMRDINRLVDFFENRPPVGRPSKSNQSSGVNKAELKRRLRLRLQNKEIK